PSTGDCTEKGHRREPRCSEGGGTLREAPPPFRSAFYGQHAGVQPASFIMAAHMSFGPGSVQPGEAAMLHNVLQLGFMLQQAAHAPPAWYARQYAWSLHGSVVVVTVVVVVVVPQHSLAQPAAFTWSAQLAFCEGLVHIEEAAWLHAGVQ